jgi:hypothetical protein
MYHAADKVEINDVKEIREKNLFSNMMRIIKLNENEITHFKPYDSDLINFDILNYDINCALISERYKYVNLPDAYDIFEELFSKVTKLMDDVKDQLQNLTPEIDDSITWSAVNDEDFDSIYYSTVIDDLKLEYTLGEVDYSITIKTTYPNKPLIFILCNLPDEHAAKSMLLYVYNKIKEYDIK